MGGEAVARAFADIRAALAVLNAEVDGCGSEPFSAADPLAGLAEGSLDILAGAAAVEAGVAGLKARAAMKYAGTAHALAPPGMPVQAQEMAVAAEIGCVLAIGPRAASAFLAVSHALTSTLPLTLAALQAGTISWQHARGMADEAATLDAAGAAALEAHFLDPDTPRPAGAATIGEMPAYRFRHKARTWRERHHPESLEKRHTKAVADRRVEYSPDQDGMAWLSAYLPAHQAMAGWNRLNALARGMQGPHEARTLTQLRADHFASAILTSGTSTSSGDGAETGTDLTPSSRIRAQVLVTVPVLALMGVTDEPAMLDGYGPIPASMARDLNPSLDNEADHLLAWHHGGTTGISNLGEPCPKHHKLRHTTGWTPTPATKNQPPDWTSPTGRHYKSEHQDWEPPHWPQPVLSAMPAHLKPRERRNGQEHQPKPYPPMPAEPGGHADYLYIPRSPGEESLHRFLYGGS
ncbi:DUF222 domain-containing protein [Pseudarthrobacter scleromae]|uniref:HNH endonuclease signature motif containing protein n=1 Tax=Pseudarthrobacter scleromae TaxID=158897 RepID=UPI00363FE4CD